MNQHVPPPVMTPHQFTLGDVLEMQALGLIEGRTQLLDGGIYDMPADGYLHQKFAMGIARIFMRMLGDDFFVGVQTTLFLALRNAPSPDIFVLRGGLREGPQSPEDILLVIEVSDSSLADDLRSAAERYARHGVREYWVVDVNTPCIHMHRDPVDGAYPPPRRVEAGEAIAARLLPQAPVRLADIA